MSQTNAELVQRARSGDRSGFEELVRRTSRLIYARIYLDVGDAHRAEDLVQETYLLAYRSLHRLQNPDGVRAWLLTIAHNVVTDSIRRESRQKRAAIPTTLEVQSLVAPERPPDDTLASDERREQILAMLRSLPEEYRLPLTMRYITGADYETIRLQLGLTNGSLRGLLQRGLKLLRERMPKDLLE
jgi:RNA polymerase sigma-70 factor, ECF subfamily